MICSLPSVELAELRAGWANAALRKSLDAYALSCGKQAFVDVVRGVERGNGQELIGHLERALQHVRALQRQLGFLPRDTLLTEVLQQQSLEHTFRLAFQGASHPASIKLVVDNAY
jgi:hypothetical protein